MFALTLALALTAAPAPCASPYSIQRGARPLPVCGQGQREADAKAWLARQMPMYQAQAAAAAAAQTYAPPKSPIAGYEALVQGGPQFVRALVNGQSVHVTILE